MTTAEPICTERTVTDYVATAEAPMSIHTLTVRCWLACLLAFLVFLTVAIDRNHPNRRGREHNKRKSTGSKNDTTSVLSDQAPDAYLSLIHI